MSSFGRRNPGYGYGGPRYPGTFLLAIQEALARLQWQAAHWKGNAVECVDLQGNPKYLGLENLYRRLRHAPRAAWPDLLVDLLGSVSPEAGTPPGDLREVAARLLVRIGPFFKQDDPETDVWNHALVAQRLVATLVIDYPNSMSYVTEKMVDDSTQDGADWLQQALANLRARSSTDGMVVVHEESGLLQAQYGDAYDSSRALLLDELLPDQAEFGFFVAVPARDHLFVLPIAASTLRLAPWLCAIASKTYREVPYPISPDIYWVRHGVWHPFPLTAEAEGTFINPPAEFMEMIARLQDASSESAEKRPAEDDSEPLSF